MATTRLGLYGGPRPSRRALVKVQTASFALVTYDVRLIDTTRVDAQSFTLVTYDCNINERTTILVDDSIHLNLNKMTARIQDVQRIDVGSFTLTSYAADIDFKINTETRDFDLATYGVFLNESVIPALSAFTLSTNEVKLSETVNVTTASFSLAALDVALDESVIPDPASFTLSPQPVAINEQEVIAIDLASLTLVTNAAVINEEEVIVVGGISSPRPLPSIAATANTEVDSTSNTHAITLPTHSAGQMIVSLITFGDNETAYYDITTEGSLNGWRVERAITLAGTDTTIAAAYKIAESASESLTVRTNSSCNHKAITFAIDNANDFYLNTDNLFGTSSTATFAPVTFEKEHSCLFLLGLAIPQDGFGSGVSTPTGYSLVDRIFGDAAFGDSTLTVYSRAASVASESPSGAGILPVNAGYATLTFAAINRDPRESTFRKRFNFNSASEYYDGNGNIDEDWTANGSFTINMQPSASSALDETFFVADFDMAGTGGVPATGYLEWTGTFEDLGVAAGSTINGYDPASIWWAVRTNDGTHQARIGTASNGAVEVIDGNGTHVLIPAQPASTSATSWAEVTGSSVTSAGLASNSSLTIRIYAEGNSPAGDANVAVDDLFLNLDVTPDPSLTDIKLTSNDVDQRIIHYVDVDLHVFDINKLPVTIIDDVTTINLDPLAFTLTQLEIELPDLVEVDTTSFTLTALDTKDTIIVTDPLSFDFQLIRGTITDDPDGDGFYSRRAFQILSTNSSPWIDTEFGRALDSSEAYQWLYSAGSETTGAFGQDGRTINFRGVEVASGWYNMGSEPSVQNSFNTSGTINNSQFNIWHNTVKYTITVPHTGTAKFDELEDDINQGLDNAGLTAVRCLVNVFGDFTPILSINFRPTDLNTDDVIIVRDINYFENINSRPASVPLFYGGPLKDDLNGFRLSATTLKGIRARDNGWADVGQSFANTSTYLDPSTSYTFTLWSGGISDPDGGTPGTEHIYTVLGSDAQTFGELVTELNSQNGGVFTFSVSEVGVANPSANNDTAGGLYAQGGNNDNQYWEPNTLIPALYEPFTITDVLNVDDDFAYLTFTDFDFTLAGSDIVTGIEVEVYSRVRDLDSDTFITEAQLLRAGTPDGDIKQNTTYWSTAETRKQLGADGDLWGESWLASDINDVNFGIRIKLERDDPLVESIAYVNALGILLHIESNVINVDTKEFKLLLPETIYMDAAEFNVTTYNTVNVENVPTHVFNLNVNDTTELIVVDSPASLSLVTNDVVINERYVEPIDLLTFTLTTLVAGVGDVVAIDLETFVLVPGDFFVNDIVGIDPLVFTLNALDVQANAKDIVLIDALSFSLVAQEPNVKASDFIDIVPAASFTLVPNTFLVNDIVGIDVVNFNLTTQIPGIDQEIAPAAETFTLVTSIVNVKLPINIDATVDLNLSTLTAGVNEVVPVESASIVLSANDVVVNAREIIEIDSASLSLTTQPPNINESVIPAAESYTLVTTDTRVNNSELIFIDLATLNLVTQPAGVNEIVAIDTANLTLTSNTAVINEQFRVLMDAASFVLSTHDITLNAEFIVFVDTALLNLTTLDSVTNEQFIVFVDTDSFAISTLEPNVKEIQLIPLTEFNVTTQDARINEEFQVMVDTASFSLVPLVAGINEIVPVDSATLNITTLDVIVNERFVEPVALATYTLTTLKGGINDILAIDLETITLVTYQTDFDSTLEGFVGQVTEGGWELESARYGTTTAEIVAVMSANTFDAVAIDTRAEGTWTVPVVEFT